MKRPRLLLVFLAAATLFGGCTNVQPWERAKLADYSMRGDRDPLHDSAFDHTYFSREAASGGRGIGGGGCGCN